ncbi:hypothetical protein AAZX31_17G033400 [Glycine max]|uniref:UBC core domain-containing protein n=2 Tax=Glycine subgen. Soja TaxID=1462606 RepID=K7MJR2_SOYBN|nr:putative ubiquitin-conjugating enzyme E2 38 [Glycine max]XP_028210634.1 putative ubiquitin-conjugating enzyme E2 38 [Glycine soja]KAG4929413.1 hypothetical protein JHK86_046374 [Glycine max]KAG4942276.1 hypothetical protein JHK85_046922 [Glycine max]KAG5096622.1 hypothetical protein JHK82_046476 [Glycine max]KAG5101412.1 hypothetical protein JHK84_046381 [Glycine max]KAH1116564.1 hypothetical protein GYH30_046124 [Glycine max]|eukprot:XP_003550562.1 putative ubiquitin-conjugating enzyme E2 38 [Glycine max]
MANTKDIERFDVVSDDSDHYFLSAVGPNPYSFTNARSDVHKRIMMEWKILANNNLPESIYVRVYANRIDLLRAVIVGAAGTPYHDGLFFFDIAFPHDYPFHPPEVHYRSYGFSLNPNLYNNGHVCLSLINTWVGKSTEKWDPCGSTVLQLLLSLQALVLNDKPFFNDFWCEMIGRGRGLFEKKSLAYNDTVFALNCKTILGLLRHPPRNFQTFVVGHFRNRARAILGACDDYANGRVRVGRYSEDGDGEASDRRVRVSEKFRESMRVLYPQLLEIFLRCGAFSQSDAERYLKMERTNVLSKNMGNVTNRTYRVLVRKVIGKIRKLYASKLISC